ncbi:IpaD/SipD/SspD family type III secretion system needle tip protein [Citrobacter sp. Igbk 16]|uniref:IpaD/SipD/SspD family type III secretion system needle tip protein n=1 Tax=Citrobacter sp. Igbk 16 TaxID=2963958 RepID=UPI0023021603|nr:IpaD/SipD/SspD family type III secretion system needle tip protein [Citrobacter sp. Igbk 16]MDA8516268.1 IpaD/SipD/SspD family type III secretion system needle tip protein [Citrobacter sp. Igbk 16]
MSTSVTAAGQLSFSTLPTTTNAVASSPEALQASTTADAAETGTPQQQVIDILTEKLAVYSEQYHQILAKGILIDTTPAQNMLKSSLSQLMNIGATSEDNSGEPSQDSANVKLSWDITFDKNMDKDGDGKIDDDIDFSTYIWSNDNDHGDGVSYPESDWEIYGNIETELSNLQTGYMDVYTDLAKQSVEFLDDVNSFKARMVSFVSTSGDKMKIDVGGVQDELDAIIDGWGIYDADGNINTTPINPATTAGPYPDRGPVAIRGLDAQGVYYWAEQLELSDQLIINTHIDAGADGKMAIDTGIPGDDIDNITVVETVANANEPPEEDCRLYLVMEADGTYTLYVYPDLQPVRDAKEAMYSLWGYRSDAGSSTAAEAPTADDIGLHRVDPNYYGNKPYTRNYKANDANDSQHGDKTDNEYFVIPTKKDLQLVPEEKAKNRSCPPGYTLVTSTETTDFKEYDCFLIPTDKLKVDDKGVYHVTEDIVLETETYNTTGASPAKSTNPGDATNIYVSDVADWDFKAHGAEESEEYGYRADAGSAPPAMADTPPGLTLTTIDPRYTGNEKGTKSYVVLPTSKDMKIVPVDELYSDGREFYIPEGYTLITSTATEDYKEYDCFLIPTTMLDPAKTNGEAGSKTIVHVTESVVVMKESYDIDDDEKGKANIYVSPASTWDFDGHNANQFATISSSLFNEWESSMNTMSSTVESQSQVMSEKLSQANTIFNNLTKVLSSTIEALQETQKEFLK